MLSMVDDIISGMNQESIVRIPIEKVLILSFDSSPSRQRGALFLNMYIWTSIGSPIKSGIEPNIKIFMTIKYVLLIFKIRLING